MLKRPSKDETEEDLLRFQEAFLQNQSASSVKIIKQSHPSQRDVVQLSTAEQSSTMAPTGISG